MNGYGDGLPFLLIFLELRSWAARRRGGRRGSVPSATFVGRRAAPETTEKKC